MRTTDRDEVGFPRDHCRCDASPCPCARPATAEDLLCDYCRTGSCRFYRREGR